MHDDDLIDRPRGGARPPTALRRRRGSGPSRRELGAHRQARGARKRLFGTAQARPREATVYYAAIATPIGRVLLATTRAGLIRVAVGRSEASFIAELRRRPAAVVRSPERTAGAAGQLRGYFAARRSVFDVPVDLHDLTPFQRRVLRVASQIPRGHAVSYGEIARRIGRPRASRAVGQALGRNPVPIVIPCHRVIAGDGSLGGYTGGLAIKKKLLRLEGWQPGG